QESHHQLYRGNGHVSQKVIIEDAFDGIFYVLPEKIPNYFTDFELALFVSVVRTHGNIDYLGADRVQSKQHVRLKKIALANFGEGQFFERINMDRGIAVSWIKKIPIAG